MLLGAGSGDYWASKGIINFENLCYRILSNLKNNELDGFPGDLEEFLLSIVKWEEQD